MGLARAILWVLLVAVGAFALLVLVRHGFTGAPGLLEASQAEFEALTAWVRAALGTGP